MLKPPDPDLCPFANHLPASFFHIFESISDLCKSNLCPDLGSQCLGHPVVKWIRKLNKESLNIKRRQLKALLQMNCVSNFLARTGSQ